MTKQQQQDQRESIETLHRMLKPGDTVWTKVNSVAKSGMSRRISLYLPVCEGTPEIRDITWDVARAMGDPVKQRGAYVQDAGLHVAGCGMDMCFATVYTLGRILFPDGFGVKSMGGIVPRSRDHAAELVEENKTTFRGRNGDESGWDNDGGYALNKRDL